MNLTMEQSQEIIKQWFKGSENIYNYNVLTYPSYEQQAYILTQHQLYELCRQNQNQQDLQKNLSQFSDQHKAIIYVMFLAPQYQRSLFDLMNINGFHNIIAFYSEFSHFINTQYHLLKDHIKIQIFEIMKLFLENPLDQLEECFKSFLRTCIIYPHNQNYTFLLEFLNFLFDQHKQIIVKPNLAALLFYKYLLILNIDDYYKIQQFPHKKINDIMIEIWQLYQQTILSFGRELLINLQIPFQYSEFHISMMNLNVIKQNLPISHLIANQTTTTAAYKANYQLALPYEVEQRIGFAIFSQMPLESMSTFFTMIFEKYGYHINFIGAIVRNIICGYHFDETEIIQNKIADALLLIYEIADLQGEKWPIFLRFIYSDIFFMTKDFKDDHNIQAGLYFLRKLYHKQLYNELQGALWFIFQTFEVNEQLKKKVQPQLLQLSSHNIFQKLLEDQNIREAIKCKIHEYFLKLICNQYQGPGGLSYDQPHTALYTVDDLDTPQVQYLNGNTTNIDDSILDEFQGNSISIQQNDIMLEEADVVNTIQIDITLQKILEKEKLDAIFQNPQQEINLIRLYNFFNKSIQPDVKHVFLQELTKIIIRLYEDQFYDLDYEYPFNCLTTLLQINFNQESLLYDLIKSLISSEQFSIHYLFLIYFERKTKSSHLEKLLIQSTDQIIKSFKIVQSLISAQRSQIIFEEILSNCQLNSNIEFVFNLLIITNIQTIQKAQNKIQNLFSSNYCSILYFLKKIPQIENLQLVGLVVDLIQKIIKLNENQKDLNILIDQIFVNLENPSKTFWTVYTQVFQLLLQFKRISEDNLIQFYVNCFVNSNKYCEGIAEIFLMTPNTLKIFIFKALTKHLDKTKNYESVEFILKYLIKDQKNVSFKNSLQNNLDNYMKQQEKK
ncbi:unnamed protein product [Paramecium pentaurelia]|uniref:Integrator complex subunit 3 N-terminal domain-containing protein n=1 Tax=Paramecium pentaurelia TaxID=43138 RepID=A0A8S1WXM1_9CILI|nr:unnamed protein product [Paramecium pentaurelia]